MSTKKIYLDNLTSREKEVASLIVDGISTGVIAKKLGIKSNTVSTIKRMIFLKFGINSEIALYKALNE